MKRYELVRDESGTNLIEDINGEYVRYEDHVAMLAPLKKLLLEAKPYTVGYERDDKMIEDGGCAFPTQALGTDGMPIAAAAFGMSMRDYFAAKVMQALVEETSVTVDDYFKAIAKLAYRHSDAMLAERSNATVSCNSEKK